MAEITAALDLTGWPEGSRVIVRRERAHPGAQLTFSDHDSHRFQAILTDQSGEIAEIERRHRARAHVEDHIRNDKDTGMRKPALQRLRAQPHLAGDRPDRTRPHHLDEATPAHRQARPLRAEAVALPILHIAGRLAFRARTATLRLQANWPWATELTSAFERLTTLPAPPG